MVCRVANRLKRSASRRLNGTNQRLTVQRPRRANIQCPGHTQNRLLGQRPCRVFQPEVLAPVQRLPQKRLAAGAAEPLGTVIQHLLNGPACRRVLPGDLGKPPDVAGHQQHRALDFRTMRGNLSADKAAQAVAHRIDVPPVEAVGLVPQDEVQYRVGVLQVIRQGVIPIAAPAPAVMEDHHMEARPAQRLRQVKIPLAAGDSVEQKDRGMGARPRRGIEHGEEPPPLSGNEDAVCIRAVGTVPVMGLLTSWLFLHVQVTRFLLSNLRVFLIVQVLLIPVFAVQYPGHQHGGHSVAAGIDEGAARVEELGHHQQHRQGDGREAKGGDHHGLHGGAAAGDGGHGHGARHRDDQGKGEVPDAVQRTSKQGAAKHNLIDGGDAGAVHVAGGAHGDNDGADLPGHAQLVAGVQLQGQRGGGGPGAQSGQGRGQDVLEEVLHAPGAGRQECVQGQEHKEVDDGGGIVDQQAPCVALEQVRTVGAGQVGEVGHQAQRRQLHQQRDHLIEHQGHIVQPGRHRLALLPEDGDRQAEEHREHDQRQNVTSGDDQREVADGEGIDDLFADAVRGSGGGYLRSIQLDRGVHAENARDNKHIDTGNSGGQHKDADGEDQQLAHPLRVRDVGDGAGDREENQRHQQNKQQVQPDLADGVQDRRLFSQGQSQDSADNDERNKDQRITVGRFLFFNLFAHNFSLHITPLYHHGMLLSANKGRHACRRLKSMPAVSSSLAGDQPRKMPPKTMLPLVHCGQSHYAAALKKQPLCSAFSRSSAAKTCDIVEAIISFC